MRVELLGDILQGAKGCQRMTLSNEVEDGKLLISVASFCFTESHHHFPRCVHADLGDFTVEGVKFWHRWVMREDRNPTSMTWAQALPGRNCCFCLKSIYLEGLTEAECGRKVVGTCEILGGEATLCRCGWARGFQCLC